MLLTPQLEDIVSRGNPRMADQGQEQQESCETLVVGLGKGLEVRYSQREDAPGQYVETVEVVLGFDAVKDDAVVKETIRIGPEQRRFGLAEGACYITEDARQENENQEPQKPQEYVAAWANIDDMITVAIEKKKEGAAINLLKQRYAEFSDLAHLKCDHVYILRTDGMIRLGDGGFIDSLRGEDCLEKGIVVAFKRYEKAGKSEPLSGNKELSEKLPSGKVALIMSENVAQNLILETHFNEEDLLNDRLRIGDKEVYLVGRARMFAKKFVDFVNRAGISTKKFVADTLAMSENELEEAIGKAMSAELSEGKPNGRKKLPENEDPRMNITQEMPREMSQCVDKIIYNNYKLWQRVAERVWVMFEGALGDKPGRKDEWKNNFVMAAASAYKRIGQTDYRMLLKIPCERLPEQGADERRVGVGNIIIDFGDRSVLEQILGGGTQMLTPQNLERAYCQNLGKMKAYMFRGRILQPMLKKILSACKPGETVLVDTCKERVQEMTRFCKPGEKEGTVNYIGREVMFTNEEAVKALREIYGNNK